jgi:release factor glutamine methyltransferase
MPPSSRQLFSRIRSEIQPAYDAEEAGSIAFLLLEHLFSLSRTAVLANKDIPAFDPDVLESAIQRLKAQEPVQYILGKTTFYGRLFSVNPAVLIPRPETEELVEWIVSEHRLPGLRVLDIGTGSGCIAVSLAAALPAAEVFALDVSAEALSVARQNGQANGVTIHWIQADILSDVSWPHPPLDIVVSNPPYVTNAEQSFMRRNVLDFEPHRALFVPDDDPLVFYRRIIEFCSQQLKPGGYCYFEVNEQFAGQVEAVFREYAFTRTAIKTDIFGKERFVRGLK